MIPFLVVLLVETITVQQRFGWLPPLFSVDSVVF